MLHVVKFSFDFVLPCIDLSPNGRLDLKKLSKAKLILEATVFNGVPHPTGYCCQPKRHANPTCYKFWLPLLVKVPTSRSKTHWIFAVVIF